MYKFNSISLFYQIVRLVKKLDDFPHLAIKNPVQYRGTIKTHGTNASIVHSDGNALQAQSRTRQITSKDDNHGFAKFVEQDNVTEAINNIVNKIRGQHAIGASKDVCLYGEWVGSGINSGCAIHQLPSKQWVLFAVKVIDGDHSYYIDAVPGLQDLYKEENIFSIMDGPVLNLEVDFHSQESKETAIKVFDRKTAEVESCCPWAKKFDIEGLGEGIVWVPVGEHWGKSDLFFKTKGEKHKNVKTKKGKEQLDPEILKGIEDFIEFAVTDNRLNQGIESIQEMGHDLQMSNISQFIKWVGQDVKRECSAELETNKIEWKQVNKAVTTKARTFFINKMKEV